MKSKIHLIAGILAPFLIFIFLFATIIVELFGSPESIAMVKSLIVTPGLFILVPTMATIGASGFAISKGRKGKLIENKKKRMPFIAMNGILILVPAAIFLDQWAATGKFDTQFYIVQLIEIIAGSINLTLLGMNIRDGLKMAGRLRPKNS